MEGEFLEVKNRRGLRLTPRADNRQYVKTRMCIYFEKNGRCRNGDQCPYAHSNAEIVSPQCHYGVACRFKERCKFSHPTPSVEPAVQNVAPSIFSSVEFPPMETKEKTPVCFGDEASPSSVPIFRDVCASGDGQKTMTIGSDAESIKNAVQEIKSAFETKPDTVFNLCFQ